MQTPLILSDILPGFRFPNDFFRNKTSDIHSIFVASCFEDGFLFVEQSFQKITGYDSTEILKKGIEWWFSLIHPDDIDLVLNITFQHCFLNPPAKRLNKTFSLEYRLRTPENRWIWLSETKAVASLTDEGKNELIIGRLENITDIKNEAQDQLMQLLKEEGDTNPLLKAAIPIIASARRKQTAFYPVVENLMQQKNITKREREILHLIGEGYSTKEIADKLYISIYTVETHRRNLLGKMQVKNSMQLVKLTANGF